MESFAHQFYMYTLEYIGGRISFSLYKLSRNIFVKVERLCRADLACLFAEYMKLKFKNCLRCSCAAVSLRKYLCVYLLNHFMEDKTMVIKCYWHLKPSESKSIIRLCLYTYESLKFLKCFCFESMKMAQELCNAVIYKSLVKSR